MKMDNRGSTLVEITAGFLMLVVVMVSFIKIINLSSEMTKTAIDIKSKNIEFDRRYYAGYNYNVDGGAAFRVSGDGTTVSITMQLTEWHKMSSGDYFEEWHEKDGKLQTFDKKADGTPLNGQVISISNIVLYRIENVRDKNMAKVNIYRYKRNN